MGCFSQDVENRRMHSAIATTPTRRKEAIMRWHSYQSLGAHARRKRIGSTGILPVGAFGRLAWTLRCKSSAQWKLAGTQARLPVLLMIERRRHSITITRGGPHRKSQRLERSIRSRSAFCGHTALFRADFLHAEGYPVLAMV